MIQEFLYEIIALVVVLIAFVIYFSKIKDKHKKQEELDAAQFNTVKKTNEIQGINLESLVKEKKPKIENETIEDEETYVLRGDEEGSFGHIDHNPFEEEQEKKEPSTKFRIKGEVPAHGKISKENFKEFAGVKILVAEDNLINQKVINGLLSDSGIEITMADDGQIALEILEKNSDYNIILMDAHMPRVDGFEATRTIRANPDYEHIVVVALSGDTAADDIKKMTDSGMQEHLEKPLRMDALYDVLYAYTKADTSSQNSDYIEIVMTKELNGDKGLAICGGDDSFYKDILAEFKENYINSSKKLSELLEAGDINSADAMLLDIIGVTANIGADNIKDIALDLKEAIKDTQEKSYTIPLEEYDKHLSALIRDIKDYI